MNELKYESIPLNLLIKHYEPIQFKYGGYTFSDIYTPPKDKQLFGAYVLRISTGEMADQKQLNGVSVQIRQLAELVTMFFKYITGKCLFYEEEGADLRRHRVLVAGACPFGWSSNFEKVSWSLETNSIHMGAILIPQKPFSRVLLSPLYELHIMLGQYARLDPSIRYLMHLNYEADLASNMIRNMAYGKVLEIIDAIHPLPRKKGKKDNRIEEYYDGMQELFKDLTISNLMDMANHRADTRHYVAAKGDVKAHAFLTYEELGKYGPLIDNLAINEVRKQFDFPFILFDMKDS